MLPAETKRLARKFASSTEAPEALRQALEALGATDVALVHNPSYIYAPFEIYPLAPKVAGPIARLAGVVKDMDGTTTTTEPLCLHALEWMVRRVTARRAREAWAGLDRQRDYPHVIGNSTTKHVEYLVDTYGADFRVDACLESYIEAALWTLALGRDANRRREVRASAGALGLGGVLEEAEFRRAVEAERYDAAAASELAARLAARYIERFRAASLSERVRASVDIYYMRYHEILGDIADGKGAARAAEVLGSPDAHLIEPMPGVGVFLAALKGWLGADLALFLDDLDAHVRERAPGANLGAPDAERANLSKIGRYLEAHPTPVAVVTSSIAYEAGVVLGEVFGILRREAAHWPVAQEKKEKILAAFESPERLYDAIVTASDSSEIRLKPHRDLYSIALHALGLGQADFPSVIGLEDSESGITAIRASGVGLAVAVPFADTAGHNLEAAAHQLPGQLPEAILARRCFLSDEALAPYEE